MAELGQLNPNLWKSGARSVYGGDESGVVVDGAPKNHPFFTKEVN